ncbi:MAG: hypothetical protein CME21_03050 [Gemmatimonadetes bacterium]|nr:hypothetical protein [Gemmatimonadota bacterium]
MQKTSNTSEYCDETTGMGSVFPTGSAELVETISLNTYRVMPKKKHLPDWFFDPLKVNRRSTGEWRSWMTGSDSRKEIG